MNNHLKIISGKYKGRTIKSPNDPKTHPMGSREKLALFNMLTPYLENATVLDAFAGSGALGLEAISHGAKKVIFVEKSPKIASVIRQNLQILDPTDQSKAKIITKDITNFTNDENFDLIIADPPYNLFNPVKTEALTKFLKPNGILALSHPQATPKSQTAPNFKTLTLLKSHSYATATLSIYQKI